MTGKFREKSFGGHTGGREKGMELELVWNIMNFMCLVALQMEMSSRQLVP